MAFRDTHNQLRNHLHHDHAAQQLPRECRQQKFMPAPDTREIFLSTVERESPVGIFREDFDRNGSFGSRARDKSSRGLAPAHFDVVACRSFPYNWEPHGVTCFWYSSRTPNRLSQGTTFPANLMIP